MDLPGYPFGSIVPYCADEQCRPIIYISHIAQHTKNILADARVSLTVVERNVESDDVQARGRITCVANARIRSTSLRHGASPAGAYCYGKAARVHRGLIDGKRSRNSRSC